MHGDSKAKQSKSLESISLSDLRAACCSYLDERQKREIVSQSISLYRYMSFAQLIQCRRHCTYQISTTSRSVTPRYVTTLRAVKNKQRYSGILSGSGNNEVCILQISGTYRRPNIHNWVTNLTATLASCKATRGRSKQKHSRLTCTVHVWRSRRWKR